MAEIYLLTWLIRLFCSDDFQDEKDTGHKNDLMRKAAVAPQFILPRNTPNTRKGTALLLFGGSRETLRLQVWHGHLARVSWAGRPCHLALFFQCSE
jgi:hypothetical protein